MHRAHSAWSGIRPALLVGGCLLALVACGKKKTPSSGSMDAGEPCLQIGQAETGCSCSPSQPPGIRHCGMDFVWSACTCRPSQVAIKCTQGQDVICSPCPGEAQGRTTKCLTQGTYDCACQSTGAGTGGTGDHDGG